MKLHDLPAIYHTIVADPPWPYKAERALGASKEHRPNSYDTEGNSPSAASRYQLMSMEQIKGLILPAARDCHLYLWTTNSFMVEAHSVARYWGFEPKTIITWVKMKPDGTPSMKMGTYYRGATEHVLFAVRGKQRLLPTAPALPTAFLSPREDQHSKKPDSFFTMVETGSPGPYLEMFARRKRDGWDAWGNEVDDGVTP